MGERGRRRSGAANTPLLIRDGKLSRRCYERWTRDTEGGVGWCEQIVYLVETVDHAHARPGVERDIVADAVGDGVPPPAGEAVGDAAHVGHLVPLDPVVRLPLMSVCRGRSKGHLEIDKVHVWWAAGRRGGGRGEAV